MWFALLAQASAQAPPPLSPDARFALALFCNGPCSEAVMDALDQGLATIPAKNGFPTSASRPLRVMGLAGTDFGMPDAAFIEVYGQGVDRPEELVKSQEVLLAWIAAPRNEALTTFATAHAAFAAAAKAGGGWIEDLDTQRLYGADAWAALDPRGPLTDWFVVDGDPQDPQDPDGDLRLVTRGLRRYGDFELVVEDVDPDGAGDVSLVVNTLAEKLHGLAEVPSTLKVATDSVEGTATFRAADPGPDDPEGPLLRATFQGEITLAPDPAPPQAALPPPVAVADTSRTAPPVAPQPVAPPPVAPSPAAPPVSPPAELPLALPVADDAPAAPPPVAPPRDEGTATRTPGPGATTSGAADPAAARPATLEEAQRQARERFARVVRPAWQAGLPAGDAVAVKAAFRTRTGTNEYMWVELRTANGTELRGVLMNEPYAVDGLHKGAMVTLSQTEIFDYIWKKADGTREGNTTAAFLK